MAYSTSYRQEYVPSNICDIKQDGDMAFNEQTKTLYEWKHNVSYVDTILLGCEYNIIQNGQTAYLKLYLGDTDITSGDPIELTTNEWAYHLFEIDASSYTGEYVLKITLQSPAAGMYWKRVQCILMR